MFRIRVGYKQHNRGPYKAHRLPSFFVSFEPVRNTDVERIIENELRRMKAYTMFPLVLTILFLIPRYSH